MSNRFCVIYARFSSELQRKESIDDQVRRCRDGLERRDIPHDHFVVIRDEGKSGTTVRRDGFQQIKKMIAQRELAMLVVTEQSRLSRGDDVTGLIKDIVFQGGRFISITENIDTKDKGWAMPVGFSQMHHSRSTEDTAERVRGGQEGRVRDGHGSAGDYPYGYRSEFADPVAAAAFRNRGPKPKRNVVIDEPEAAVVREVFKRFADDRESIGSIVRWWESQKQRLPRIAKTRINHGHIRRMLANEKYIGTWVFGRTTTVRNNAGTKKQVPAKDHQTVTVVPRPELRLVEQGQWDRAQSRLALLAAIYGLREGGKKRGPSKHYRLMYETSLLGGQVRCASCGATMLCASSGAKKALACPNHRAGTCAMGARVDYAKAEQAVLNVLAKVLKTYPGWLQLAADEARKHAQRLAAALPNDLEKASRDLSALETKIQRLLDLVESGLESDDLRSRLAAHQRDKATLQERVAQAGRSAATIELPDDDHIRNELANLGKLIANGGASLTGQLRPLIDVIIAREVKPLGKRRGFVVLNVKLNPWAVLRKAVDDKLPEESVAQLSVAETLSGRIDPQTSEIPLGGPTNLDKLGPQIVEWRRQKVKWKEITRRTGLTPGNAWTAYKRVIDAQRAA